MKRTVALIQARMSSSRFPGKVLQDLGGVPMIVFMGRRVTQARTVDEVAVITSTDSSDDQLYATLSQHGMRCIRGDLHDVLDRYRSGAEQTEASLIVRLTGDCPLVDPALIDRVVCRLGETAADYTSNVEPPTFPDGLDVECFTRAALELAHERARASAEREHVTLWMRSEAAGLKRASVNALVDLSHLRLTVDYPDDLHAVRRVLAEARRIRNDFDLFDVLRVLDQYRAIIATNPHPRNEGLAQSLAEAGQPWPVNPAEFNR